MFETIHFTATHFWIAGALVLFIVEAFAPSFVFMSFGLACLCSALVSAAGCSLPFQLVAFIAGVALSLATVRPVLLRFFSHPDPDCRTNVYALVGKVGVVEEAVRALTAGRVRVAGEDWRALPASRGEFLPGDRVLIARIEGATLYIEPPHQPTH